MLVLKQSEPYGSRNQVPAVFRGLSHACSSERELNMHGLYLPGLHALVMMLNVGIYSILK